ncbi:MAG: efflux RND transporter permease subunit [Pseudomonadota bacterium]
MFEKIIERGTILAVVVLVIAVLGTLAALRIPVQMIPDLEVRVVTVETSWPGATPQDVEKEILIEQEEFLRSLPGLERMVSTASYGGAEIRLEFPFGVDINEALIRVNNALSQVTNYPENVNEPRLDASSFSQNSFMFFYVRPLPDNPFDLDVTLLRDFVDDNVRTRMERVAGVSRVNVYGGAERQVRILVDPAAAAERGITLDRIRAAIRARNRDVSGGDLDAGKRRYLLRTVGRFESVDQMADTILRSEDDQVVRLGDVAEVELSRYEIRNSSAVNGLPTLTLSVDREPGSNVIDIKRAMLPTVDQINEELLRANGLELGLISDDAKYVEASVANVWKNLGIGALLATAVMFVFLRSAKATLVGVVGVPICTIAAFLGLLAAGRTINVISLAGVAFAIGMTLDNSIVVLEAIERNRRRGMDRLAAAVSGVREVWSAVLASTMTTVLVFAPIFFIREEAGQLYSDIAVAISASILASMLIAVTVVPALSARLSFGFKSTGETGHTVRKRLVDAVDWLVRSPTRRLSTVALTLIGVVLVLVLLTPAAEYLPEGEEPKTFASMIAPPGHNYTEMRGIAREIEAELLPYVKTDRQAFVDGKSDMPPISYVNLYYGPDRLRVIAEAVDPADIDALMAGLKRQYEQYPGMRAFAARGSIISSNDGGTRSVNLDITGQDLAELYAVAETAYRYAEAAFNNPSINSSPGSLSLDQPLIEVRPNWYRAAELGFSADSLGFAVAALTDGAFVDEFIRGDDKIDIFLYSSAGDQQQLGRVASLPVFTPSGAVVPLSSVATIDETVATDSLRRLNGRRTVTLNIIPPRSTALEIAVERVRTDVVERMRADGRLPQTVTVDISGAGDQLTATRAALADNYLVAIVLTFLVLVAIFTHWGWPLVILTAVPLGIAGGIGGLVLMNGLGVRQPFDMITMLGFLILLGVVVNNPILIVDGAITNLRAGASSAVDAVRDAVSTRIRPIMMSMITTLFGLAPLVFLPGEGTELYRGVGVVVLAGLLFSTLVTLSFLPALLVMVLEARQRWWPTLDSAKA